MAFNILIETINLFHGGIIQQYVFRQIDLLHSSNRRRRESIATATCFRFRLKGGG